MSFNTLEKRVTALKEELEEVVDGFYEGVNLCQSIIDEETQEEIMLEDAIAELFANYRDVIIMSSIETDTCFESPGIDVGVVSVVYVNQVTGLEHFILRWERV